MKVLKKDTVIDELTPSKCISMCKLINSVVIIYDTGIHIDYRSPVFSPHPSPYIQIPPSPTFFFGPN